MRRWLERRLAMLVATYYAAAMAQAITAFEGVPDQYPGRAWRRWAAETEFGPPPVPQSGIDRTRKMIAPPR